jgi:hypothetical protein
MTYIGQFIFVSSHGRLLQAHTDGEMHATESSTEKDSLFYWTCV